MAGKEREREGLQGGGGGCDSLRLRGAFAFPDRGFPPSAGVMDVAEVSGCACTSAAGLELGFGLGLVVGLGLGFGFG